MRRRTEVTLGQPYRLSRPFTLIRNSAPATPSQMPHGGGTPMSHESPRSLRRAYLEWVEEQVEDFKDAIPRSRLLAIADEVVEELRLSRGGQYQLTEILLCDAMNRYLFRLLKLPGYRAWCEQRATDREEP